MTFVSIIFGEAPIYAAGRERGYVFSVDDKQVDQTMQTILKALHPKPHVVNPLDPAAAASAVAAAYSRGGV